MPRLRLFYRFMLRPLFREPVRTALTVFAIALGVAVVLAIDLAGNAATGSFHSSMETLSGDNDLEITASGGIPEAAVGTLAGLPYNLRISPRIEDFAVVTETKQALPLIGLDLVAQANSFGAGKADAGAANSTANVFPSPLGGGDCGGASSKVPSDVEQSSATSKQESVPAGGLPCIDDPESIWVGSSLGRAPGDKLRLLINDEEHDYIVRGVYPDSEGNEAAIVMDIASAQRALSRFGRIDRVLIKTPDSGSLEEWQQRISSVLPVGVDVRPQGAGTEDNRRMLAAFGWNLRLLSGISLVVGAFLIYNTISVSVVRRRPEIGILRALGASRVAILFAFLSEAVSFGVVGALLALPFGRLMANGAVKLMGATVNSLYVSSRPGAIELTAADVALALLLGVGVAVASAFSPAREASLVSPVQAMARARREYETRVSKTRDLWIALLLGVAAAAASRVPPIAGKPFFGYVACLLLVAAAALAMPAFVALLSAVSSRWLGRQFGAEAMLASRSLAGSLRRTSVLVAALSTAIAMMVSVGIMVGSFRETVITWMNDQLPADLYVRPAGNPSADHHPTLSLDVANTIAKLPGVAAVDRLRAYEISYEGAPATLSGVDLSMRRAELRRDFFSGRSPAEVFAQLRGSNNVIVSEPFTSKHHVSIGYTITLPLSGTRANFRVIDVYYDYSSEGGEILMDRNTLLRYLPDPAPTNLSVYVEPGAAPEKVRGEILDATRDHHILIASNREIRTQAIRVFDRTFAITYALEAIAVLVAVMGIAGALLALVIDRRRELGLLRFLGADNGQIRKLILTEAGLLGLFANLAGAALGLLLSLILIFVINKQSFGWTIRFHWPVEILFGALTFVYVATVLAGIYPASVAVRLNPLEVLHEE